MEVIGLSGYARAGKDSIADYLVEEYGYEKRSFAEPLKQMLRDLNPIVAVERNPWFPWNKRVVRVEDLYDLFGDHEAIKASKYGDEMRALWQRLGTDAVRKLDDQFWVRAAFGTLTEDSGKYVFTDVRFPIEAEAINSLHGIMEGYESVLWAVQRPGVQAANGHESEQHVGNMGEHYNIVNDGSVDDLYRSVEEVLRHMATDKPAAEAEPVLTGTVMEPVVESYT